MSNLKFEGPIELYYPTLGLTATPGEVVDLAEAPDIQWVPETVGEPTVATPTTTQEN